MSMASMSIARRCLAAVLLAVACGGVMTAVNLSGNQAGAEERPPAGPAGDHWRFYDGHWSYWHEGDKRWYYTDGSHWFFHNGSGWAPYQFDAQFGRNGFVPGPYQPPAVGVNVTLPLHNILRHL
ncbi:MAG TPA: hypothetical protein VHZ24_11035 [Pirellulales bacterium]|jgi:hypothetical protein|nr:hypothetical protein [Pirellulales bacterium]